MKKANGPKKKKKNLITHLMTMPQAAGKNVASFIAHNSPHRHL